MPVFKGIVELDTPVYSDTFNIPATIKSFSVYNSHTAPAVVIVSIVNDSLTEQIIIFSKSLANRESFLSDIPILILPGYLIKITTAFSYNFYFTIE
jgi:hypothetical protein